MKFPVKKFVLLLITCVFLYIVLNNLNLHELIRIIKNFNLKYIILLIISVIISLTFRGICFKQLISSYVNVPLKDLVPLCITGAALNIVLPARAGDIFRAFYVGSKYNENKVKIFGSVMLERIFDGLVVLSILLLGIFLYEKNPLAKTLCITSALLFITSLIIAYLAFKYNKTDDVCRYIGNKIEKFPNNIKGFLLKIIQYINNTCNSFLNGFEVFKSPGKLLFVLLSSICIWGFECLCYYIVILGFGITIDWTVVLFIIGFISLACMIPSTSIFVGPYQFAIIAAFSIYNVNKENALAISFTEQTIVTLTTAVIALIFLVKNNISFKQIKKDINIKE